MSEAKSVAIQRMQLIRKIVLFVFLIAVIALAAFTRTMNGETPFHEILETVGLILIGVAIVGRGWCSLYIGGRKKAEIIDQGPYSITRNPLYVFSFIGAFGIGAQTGSVVLALVFTLIAYGVFLATVKREEVWLLDAFGAPYADYLKRTPRFWPKFSLWRAAETLEVRPKFFLTTIADGLTFLLAIPIFELIERAQDSGWIHTIFTLP